MPMQAQRKSGSTGPTHSQAGTRRRWVVSITLRPLYPWKEPVTIMKGDGWVSGPFWVARNSRPDRPARGETLYHLSYSGHLREQVEAELQPFATSH